MSPAGSVSRWLGWPIVAAAVGLVALDVFLPPGGAVLSLVLVLVLLWTARRGRAEPGPEAIRSPSLALGPSQAGVIEALPHGVFWIDAERVVRGANAAARALLGTDRLDPLGRVVTEVIRAPDFRDAIDAAQEPPFAMDLPDARGRVLALRGTPLHPGWAVLISDVTEERRRRRLRDDYLGDASHELRTPVSVILANAEALLDGGVDQPAVARTLLGGIDRHARRLARLVDDLLDLSRLEGGVRSLDVEDLPLFDLFHEVVDLLAENAKERGVHIAVAAGSALTVRADAKALERILHNLLDNAIKYGPVGGQVRIDAVQEPDRSILVRVDDDGPGIELRDRQRVFERFYRADRGRARAQGGAGLGLAIVGQLAAAMGADVGVERGTRGGARFWVRFRPADAFVPEFVAPA
jgi:signal transduction histidine kinase